MELQTVTPTKLKTLYRSLSYASLDLAASLRLLVTLRFQARRRLSRTGFTVPPCSVRGIWTNCDGQYENVGGARCLDWTDVDKLELVFPFSELSVSELNSSVRVTGDGPGWLEDLRWLPNRFAVEIKGAGLFPILKVRTRLSDPVFDGDQLLAAALAEFADQHTSLLGDLQHVGLKLRLLDAFGAFPASRLIAFAYMMASRKSGQKLRVVRPATTGAYTPCAGASSSWRDDPQRSEFKFLSEAWYRRSTELGDPVAASMAERKYHVLGEPFQQDLCGKRRNLYELPTTLSARALAPRFLSRDRALAQAVRVVFAAAE